MRFPTCFEATTGRAEFVRLLPLASADESIRETPEGYAGQGWQLILTALPLLEIGSVRLERFRVELRFEGFTDAEQEAFMRRFTRYYQRGGG